MMNLEQLTEFLKHYGSNPFGRPKHRIPEFLNTVDSCPWARTPEKLMTIAGAVSAFIHLYPVDVATWRANYPDVFKMSLDAIRFHAAVPDHPGWVAVHLSRWFILRNPVEIDQLLKLAGRGGETGRIASAALEVASSEFPTFTKTVKDLRNAETCAMVIQ